MIDFYLGVAVQKKFNLDDNFKLEDVCPSTHDTFMVAKEMSLGEYSSSPFSENNTSTVTLERFAFRNGNGPITIVSCGYSRMTNTVYVRRP